MPPLYSEYKSCTIKIQLFDLVVKDQGHTNLILIYETLACPNTCPCGHLYQAATYIKRSHFSCPVIDNFIWIEPLLRGHLSYKPHFICPKGDLWIQVWLYIQNMKAVDLKREKFCHRKRCMIKNQLFNIVVKGQCHRVLLLKCNTTSCSNLYIYIYPK
jgi:hypothetical protein